MRRVHRDDVVESPKRRIEHVADAKVAAPRPVPHGRSLAREFDERGRKVDRDDLRAAPRRSRPPARRCRSRHRGCARPCRSSGSQRSRVAPHLVAPGAHRGADAARPARPTSAASRPRPRCGRNRSRARPGALEVGRGRHQSNPRRSKMSRSFIGLASSGSAPVPQPLGQRAGIRSAPPRAPATAPSRTASTS